MRNLRLSRAAMNQEDGSILVLDILGGHAGESSVKLRRQNEISGTDFSLHSNFFGTKKLSLHSKGPCLGCHWKQHFLHWQVVLY